MPKNYLEIAGITSQIVKHKMKFLPKIYTCNLQVELPRIFFAGKFLGG